MPILESAIISGTIFLGHEALKLIRDSAKSYIGKRFESFFKEVEDKIGDKERDDLEIAYMDAMANGYCLLLESLSNILKLAGLEDDEMRRHRTQILIFLDDEEVGNILWDSLTDLANDEKPNAESLEIRWRQTQWNLPVSGIWPLLSANFRNGAKKKAFITPQLREILLAETIDRIANLQRQILGVRLAVCQDQYARIMQTKYAQVELANVAPAYTEDPGLLIVTDIFEPQHVRENPPSVEITKDEFEKLIRQHKSGNHAEDALTALLVEGDEKEAAEKLKFQRSSYAEQPVIPVLEAITPLELLSVKGFTMHNRLNMITGEPGSGKSTLLRYILLTLLSSPPNSNIEPVPHWTKHFLGERKHFPLLIELRDYHFTCKEETEVNCFLDYVNFLGKSQGWGLNSEWLHEKLTSGPSIVMFDGLDEIFEKRERDTVMKQISGFVETYPNSCVIVTSRPHGYHDNVLRPVGFRHFRLQDLDFEQKKRFVEAWFMRVFPRSDIDRKARVERVLNAIQRSPSVRWLAGNPLLLTIMCLIGREKELPRERARFYEECVDVLVHKWDLNHHLQIRELEFLNIDDKKDLLRRIAFHMQASNAGLRGNFIGEKELFFIIETWFKDEHELSKVSAKLAAKQMIQGLWERNYLLCPRGPKLYGFLHRTFMEYLTSVQYVMIFHKEPEFTISELTNIFKKRGNEPEWAEVLRLICGAIGDNYAEKLIRHLIGKKIWSNQKVTIKNQPTHLIIALRCLGELRGLARMEALAVCVVAECIKFFEKATSEIFPSPSFHEELVDAAKEIGSRWPKSNILRNILCDVKLFTTVKPGMQNCEATFIAFQAAILSDRLLVESHLLSKNWRARRIVLQILLDEPKWIDKNLREMLESVVYKDESDSMRSFALSRLAITEEWLDANLYDLIKHIAIVDSASVVRCTAINFIQASDEWINVDTANLLSRISLEDGFIDARTSALTLLANEASWRSIWLDTMDILKQQIVQAASGSLRGLAACAWYDSLAHPCLHENEYNAVAFAKSRVFSKDFDGVAPFIDPLKPVSLSHMELIIDSEDPELLDMEYIPQILAEISNELGWDITKGFQI